MLKKLIPLRHRDALRRSWQFLTDDVWDIELSTLSGLRRFGVEVVRVFQLVFKGFRDDECPLHASALTFNTLMSIVPILALSLAVARGFDGDATAKAWVQDQVSTWTEQFSKEDAVNDNLENSPADAYSPTNDVTQVSLSTNVVSIPASSAAEGITPEELADQINALVEGTFEKVDNISFRALGGVGLALLLWMVISVLGRVEASFNQVWGVTAQRPLWRKFTDYLSILLVFPILIIAATSLPLVDFATRFLDDSTADFVRRFLLSGALKHCAVIALTCLSFSLLLMFMPNVSVRLGPGLVGGTATGLLFLLWMWACASIQIGVANTGRIYGTFAVLPILLVWVNVSWRIMFLGAEVAFAVQNCATFRMEQGARRANVRAKLTLALTLVLDAAKVMDGSRSPLKVSQFAGTYRVPVRFLNDVVQELVEGGLLAELSEAPASYVLLRAPEFVMVSDVIKIILQHGVGGEDLGLERVDTLARGVVGEAAQYMYASLDGVSIRDLMRRGDSAAV
jgi:membrane protein